MRNLDVQFHLELAHASSRDASVYRYPYWFGRREGEELAIVDVDVRLVVVIELEEADGLPRAYE
jgi:hypothetical protein